MVLFKQVFSHPFCSHLLLKKQYSLCVVSNFSKSYSCKNMGVPLEEIVKQLQDIAPLKLAESWDNVGLLIEPNRNKIIRNILLTIDLTEDVVEEAITTKSDLIISYHPNIFKPLKRLTECHWKERIVLKCIRNDIAVFSPHTSWDAMSDGVNDWLASSLKPKESKPIVCNAENPVIGMGRLLVIDPPISLKKALEDVKANIGLPYLRVGIGRKKDLNSLISTAAICAGSGASLLNGLDADLYLTGEMLHHDVLEATQKGTHVILCNHSDSERGYLKIFQKKLQSEILKVILSEKDHDCLTTM